MTRHSALLFGFSLVALSACSVQLELPGLAEVACVADAQCPDGRVCVEDIGLCRRPGAACIEERGGRFVLSSPGTACALSGTGDGICLDGACRESVCGDGYIDLDRGEACDDGADNADAPDRCRASTCQVLDACMGAVVQLDRQ